MLINIFTIGGGFNPLQTIQSQGVRNVAAFLHILHIREIEILNVKCASLQEFLFLEWPNRAACLHYFQTSNFLHRKILREFFNKAREI